MGLITSFPHFAELSSIFAGIMGLVCFGLALAVLFMDHQKNQKRPNWLIPVLILTGLGKDIDDN